MDTAVHWYGEARQSVSRSSGTDDGELVEELNNITWDRKSPGESSDLELYARRPQHGI